MTKAKAIALLNEMHSHCILRSATDAYDDALRDQKGEALMMAIEALSKPTVTEWIPVAERIPEEKDAGILKKLGTSKRSEYVLATVEVKGERMTVTVCTYDGEWDWKMKYAFPDYKIIAWMPFPKPYREERTEE